MDIIHKAESYAIMGACFEVYEEKGNGFLEAVYQECLAIEFGVRNVPFQQHAALPLTYKGQALQHVYVADFICYDKIIIEIKAASELTNQHRAQVHNYLAATGFRLGLLVNFGHHPGLQRERLVL